MFFCSVGRRTGRLIPSLPRNSGWISIWLLRNSFLLATGFMVLLVLFPLWSLAQTQPEPQSASQPNAGVSRSR